MPRAKRSTVRKDRRTKVLKRASGYYGAKGRLHRIAKLQVEKKSLTYAFRDRRNRKRNFRRLWIVRINAAAREHELTYSTLMHGLGKAGITLDRKVLADIAYRDTQAFAKIAAEAKRALATAA